MAVIGGTGYVGLTTAVCFATKGHVVYCVGRSKEKIERLRKGQPIIYEAGLGELLGQALKKGRFIASTDLMKAVADSKVIFICVGTPSRDDGSIDLSEVEDASRQIGLALRSSPGYRTIVVKSTVVPGTTEQLVIPILETSSGRKAGKHFGVCMNPEFLREGQAISDFLHPKEQGIVVGELDKRSGDVLSAIYRDFPAEFLRTALSAAEMIKYARNSYLAKDVSFANEIANISQRLGVDYLEVKRGMEADTRIGKGRFLDAGAGFGGSCFPKDVKAIVARAKEFGVQPTLLEATLKVNEGQPLELVRMAKQILTRLKGKRICVLGLAFKPGTDDMREASSIRLIESLLAEGCTLRAYDPEAMENAGRIFGEKLQYARTAEEGLKDADACIIVTEWPEFSSPKLYAGMRGKVVIDGRRALDYSRLPSGFIYQAIGFPEAKKTPCSARVA